MQRRTFLRLSFAGTAALSILSLRCSNKDPALQKILAQPFTLSRLCDEKTLKDIGNVYRKNTPAENDPEKLRAMLLAEQEGKPVPSSTDPSFIRLSLQQKIKQDFEEKRITVVNGWILSVTEARQCALVSLS